ncbi:MAG: NADH-quinone oxidoreductase subunit C [Planctomycetota bacterium]
MSSHHTPAHVAGHTASKARADGLLAAFEPRPVATRCGTPSYVVAREVVHDALAALRAGGYEVLSFITAVDRLSIADGRVPQGRARFLLVHQIEVLDTAEAVRVETELTEADATAPTVTDLWPGASFMEREVYDMFGIRFDGHPNLTRLLMPDGYGHHPLRKEFPHQGIEPDRLYREWDERRRAQDPSVPPEEQAPSPFQRR